MWLVAGLFFLSMAGVVSGQALTVKTAITKLDGSDILFKTEKGEKEKSKISSKRTKVMKGTAAATADDLKEGMKIEITYVKDGNRNEPSLVKIIDLKEVNFSDP